MSLDEVRSFKGSTIPGTCWKLLDHYIEEGGKAIGICECSCGEVRNVSLGNISYGGSRSCTACSRKGKRNPNYKGGMADHPLFYSWHDMKRRILNKSHARYKDYGGRGLTISKRFMDFWKFVEYVSGLAGYEDRKSGLSLDRIDNNKGYVVGNLRWADATTQNRNKRSSCKNH